TNLKKVLRPITLTLLSCGENSKRTVSRSCKHRGPEFCDKEKKADSNALSGRVAGGPGPLKVVAAEVTGHVHDLPDEVEAGDAARLQRFGRKLVGRDAAARDLSLLKSLGAVGQDAPVVEQRRNSLDLLLRVG